MKDLDVVLLKDGRKATILEVFKDGEAYMVEVADKKGRALDMPIVTPDQIEKVIFISK